MKVGALVLLAGAVPALFIPAEVPAEAAAGQPVADSGEPLDELVAADEVTAGGAPVPALG